MLLFDIGANRGDAVVAGLQRGFNKIIAVEAAPKVFAQLVANFIYEPKVIPLKFAVSNVDDERITFFECVEDGLSTLNEDWLTDESLPYAGKEYRTIEVTTVTVDSLVELYGKPDLMKIDVEGAEWDVFYGISDNYGMLTFEWTDVTLDQHMEQLLYLQDIGYTEFAPQFITHHLEEPTVWFPLESEHIDALPTWVEQQGKLWTAGEWKVANLRPTADVGMIWVR